MVVVNQEITRIAQIMFPQGNIEPFTPYWEECFGYAGINSKLRIGMFLAQVGHECQGFTRFEENLYYSADGLANTWPTRYALKKDGKYVTIIKNKIKYYTPNDLAKQIARKPEVIANKTYAKRLGNGDENSGDGWKYRGRGLKMLTGEDNYRAFTNFMRVLGYNLDFVKNPELLLEPKWALWSAVWFWKTNGLNKHADNSDVLSATKTINGGKIGLQERQNLFVSAITRITAIA